jgi:uncharacterized damage-inducible protein DinB
MNPELQLLYRLTQTSRRRVLSWLVELPDDVLRRERDDVAYGSVLGIYSHIANCYLHWVNNVALGNPRMEDRVYDSITELEQAFAEVDKVVMQAIETLTDWNHEFIWTSGQGWSVTVSNHWLMWHPITHEFHHKGQALAVGRLLGHPYPNNQPDSDLPGLNEVGI